MGKKRNKFKYDPEEYEEDDKLPPPITIVKTLRCPQNHPLDERNWSSVRKSYFCPGCVQDVKKELTILV